MLTHSIKIKILVCTLSVVIASAAVAQDSIFTYQGELKDGGSLSNGNFAFEFRLWDTLTGGSQVGPTNSLNSVPVVDGRFSVELDFGAEAFGDQERYLAISVNSKAINPRQPVTRAPYSIQTRGLFVNEAGRVAIGRTSAGAQLDVFSESESSGNNTARFYSPILGPNASHIHYGLSGDWFIRSADSDGKVVLQDTGGGVAIGTSNPSTTAKVTVNGGTQDNAILALSLDNAQPTIKAINIDSGAAIWAQGTSDVSLGGGGLVMAGYLDEFNISIDANEIMARNDGSPSNLLLNREGGNVVVGSASNGSSRLVTPVLQITGGSDFSEMFDVTGETKPCPGMVVVIDPDHPGQLALSSEAYDKKVAGIISGAGGVATGMTMGQKGSIADGQYPVALTGRVYCWVDAANGEVCPGDLLTTSSTLGHAMKVSPSNEASGSTIGKAMTGLEQGEKGLVLVLVNLQ